MYPLFLNAYYKFLDCKAATTAAAMSHNSTSISKTTLDALTTASVNEMMIVENNCIVLILNKYHVCPIHVPKSYRNLNWSHHILRLDNKLSLYPNQFQSVY